jgi:hypothetical protein
MAVAVNVDELPEKGKEANPETKFIKAGNHLARLVSYVELGVHKQMFKGQPVKYESGKNAGREKPAVLHVGMTFEFPACEYTGDYPLTISTTRRMDNGEFFDAVTVPHGLTTNPPTITKGGAMKTKFMKFLTRLQDACDKPYSSIAEFAKAEVPLLISVTNKKAVVDGKDRVYANMKPEGINSCRVAHPVTGEITDYSADCPPTKGEYCKVFDWDAPTAEAWKALKPWDKTTIKAALNFKGSPIDELLSKHPELDEIAEGKADGNAVKDETPKGPVEPTTPGKAPAQEDIPV